jgi:hypothetical protein
MSLTTNEAIFDSRPKQKTNYRKKESAVFGYYPSILIYNIAKLM